MLYDRMTALDFVGVYDPVTRLQTMHFRPDLRCDLCALTSTVMDDRELEMSATVVGEPLHGYDLLIVPGGYGTRRLQKSERFIAWLKTAEKVPLKASVCSGALLLGACGWLRGRRATTHAGALTELAAYCSQVVSERVVDEGEVITAGGVTAAIDLGLHLVRRLAGAAAAQQIARQMEYPAALA